MSGPEAPELEIPREQLGDVIMYALEEKLRKASILSRDIGVADMLVGALESAEIKLAEEILGPKDSESPPGLLKIAGFNMSPEEIEANQMVLTPQFAQVAFRGLAARLAKNGLEEDLKSTTKELEGFEHALIYKYVRVGNVVANHSRIWLLNERGETHRNLDTAEGFVRSVNLKPTSSGGSLEIVNYRAIRSDQILSVWPIVDDSKGYKPTVKLEVLSD